jgi:cell wall-associated NlpC family hydrolase
MTGLALAAAAESLVGAPFRLHGRDPERGLDCVGLVAAALAACGRAAEAPAGYGLRNRSIGAALELAERAGLLPADGPIQPGDVILTAPGPAQHHLAIAADESRFIHAHAGLRQVIATPAPLPWPVLRRWRLAD